MIKIRGLKLLSVVVLLFSYFVSVEALKSESKSPEIFSKNEIDVIKKIAIEALLENPEILIEVSKILKERDEKEKSKNISRLLKEYRNELFDVSDTDVLGNPNGDITIVEFFDGIDRERIKFREELENEHYELAEMRAMGML